MNKFVVYPTLVVALITEGAFFAPICAQDRAVQTMTLTTLYGVSRFFVGIIFYLREVLLTSRYEKRLFEHASQPCVAGTDIRLLPHLRSRTNLSRDSYPFG